MEWLQWTEYARHLLDAADGVSRLPILPSLPKFFEEFSGTLLVVRDPSCRRFHGRRVHDEAVPWSSPRGWRKLRGVDALDLSVQYRTRSDGAFKYRKFRIGKDNSLVLLHVIPVTDAGFAEFAHIEATLNATGLLPHGVVSERPRAFARGSDPSASSLPRPLFASEASPSFAGHHSFARSADAKLAYRPAALDDLDDDDDFNIEFDAPDVLSFLKPKTPSAASSPPPRAFPEPSPASILPLPASLVARTNTLPAPAPGGPFHAPLILPLDLSVPTLDALDVLPSHPRAGCGDANSCDSSENRARSYNCSRNSVAERSDSNSCSMTIASLIPSNPFAHSAFPSAFASDDFPSPTAALSPLSFSKLGLSDLSADMVLASPSSHPGPPAADMVLASPSAAPLSDADLTHWST